MDTQELELRKLQLKVQNYREKLANTISSYEEVIADYRIEHTLAEESWREQVADLANEVERLRNEVSANEEPEPDASE